MNNCPNEVLSEERQLMKSVEIFRMGIFWVRIFRGGVGVEFPVGSLMGGNFPGGNFPGGNFPRTMFFISLHFKVFSLKFSHRA